MSSAVNRRTDGPRGSISPGAPSHRPIVAGDRVWRSRRAAAFGTALIAALASQGDGIRSANAADIQFANVLPGSRTVTKSVESMRERRFRHMVTQQMDFSCGAAAVATVLKYAYGREVKESEVIASMLKVADPAIVQERGFSMLDMKHYVEDIGMRGRGYQVQPYMLDSIKIPVIVLLDIKGYQHFVVLKKTADGKSYIGDPVLGNRIMSKDEFILAWNGIVFAIIGQGFIQDTVLINPQPPLTASALRGVLATIPATELVEYGFKSADFF